MVVLNDFDSKQILTTLSFAIMEFFCRIFKANILAEKKSVVMSSHPNPFVTVKIEKLFSKNFAKKFHVNAFYSKIYWIIVNEYQMVKRTITVCLRVQ